VWFGRGLGGSEVQELLAFLGAHNGVAVLQWPRDAHHIDPLSKAGLPRLLLVHPSPQAPPADGPLQTALPSSADSGDIHVHLIRLGDQAARWRSKAGPPSLDGESGMQVGDRRTELPAVEHRLAGILATWFGWPVDDELLFASEASDSSLTAARLRGHLARLSRLINPLGLEVSAVGGESHVMRWCTA